MMTIFRMDTSMIRILRRLLFCTGPLNFLLGCVKALLTKFKMEVHGTNATLYAKIQECYDKDALPEDPEMRKKLKKKILKNLVLLSVVFIFLFTAYNGLGNLQSSLHTEEGLGTVTQSILYGTGILSSLLMPKLMISTIGFKCTMLSCMLGYMSWMVANGYAVWLTMAPTSVIVGMAAAPLWTAKNVYFNKLAPKYAALLNEPEELVLAKSFGLFGGLFQISTLAGAVISSTVLRPPGGVLNKTAEEILATCGLNDCPYNNITTTTDIESKPSTITMWTLIGIYIAITCLGMVILSVWVDDLPKYLIDDPKVARRQIKQNLLKTAILIKNPIMCLLIPFSISRGLEMGFYFADWNKSFVSCSLGIWMVGLVAIPACIANAFSAYVGGHCLKCVSRIPLLSFGFIVHIAFQVALIYWPPHPDKAYVFYLLSVFHNVADGVWTTQGSAMMGSMFPENLEGAFASQGMWSHVGTIIAFGYSSFLCTKTKMYILIIVSSISMVLYYVAEWLHHKNTMKKIAVKDCVENEMSDLNLLLHEHNEELNDEDEDVEI